MNLDLEPYHKDNKSLLFQGNILSMGSVFDYSCKFNSFIDTNAYKLQPSLSKRVIVDGHACHAALHFGVKAKENQDKVPTLYWLPKLYKNIILVLIRQHDFPNC